MKLYAIAACMAITTCAFSAVVFAADAPNAAQATPAAPVVPRPMQMQRQVGYAFTPVSLLNTITPLTDSEKVKIQSIQNQFRNDMQAARTDNTDNDAAQQKMKDLRDQANKDVRAALTADQLAVIDKYMPGIQLLLASAKGGPGALEQVTLTADQLGKLKDIGDELTAKQTAIMQEMQQKMQALAAQMKTQAADVLTADQKAALENRATAGNGQAPAAATTTPVKPAN
jgi:hypothetical protein